MVKRISRQREVSLASTSPLRAKNLPLTLLGLITPARVVLGYSRLCEGVGTLAREVVTLPTCVPGGGEDNRPDQDIPEAFGSLGDQKSIQYVLLSLL